MSPPGLGLSSIIGSVSDIVPPSIKSLSDMVLPSGNQKKKDESQTDTSYSIYGSKLQPIDKLRWDRLYKYYFAIMKLDPNTGALRETAPQGLSKARVYLNIFPQSIAISTPFSMSVIATSGGILEESNGSVFKNISISGTTGIWKDKTGSTAQKDSTTFDKVAQFFPAATAAAQGFLSSVKRVVDNVDGEKKSTPAPADLTQTGYYQFWDLHHFLVSYAEAKKDLNGSGYRLVFGMPKDGVEYIVTPVSFDMHKDTSNPLMYRYSISLKSWGINIPTGNKPEDLSIPTPRRVSLVKSVVNTLRSVREAITSASGVIAGVQSDLLDVMQAYNQVLLGIADAVGLWNSIRDFAQVFENNKNLIVSSGESTLRDEIARSTSPFRVRLPAYESASDKSKGIHGEDNLSNTSTLSPYAQRFAIMLKDPNFYNRPVSALEPLPKSVTDQIDAEKEKAKKTTSQQVRNLAQKLQEATDNLSSATGSMDPIFAVTYGVPVGIPSRTVTEADIILMSQIMDAKTGFVSFLATGEIFRERDVDPFAIARQNLDSSDTITTPLSAYAVAVDQYATLDDIALKYLGDMGRGRDIAILNHLRSPYIDEDGAINSISGVEGRTFITDFGSLYAAGQRVQIKGNGVADTYRRVLGKKELGGGAWRVTVDGRDNLDMFTPSTIPRAWARQPGTIGSGDTVLIPDDASTIEQANRPTVASEALSHAEKVFGIDLALDDTGDLAKGADGDFSKAMGYDNASQILKILIETQKGELKAHPSYGLNVGLAFPNTNLDGLSSDLESQIRADGRFQSSTVDITVEGSVVRTRVSAQGAGGTGIIPVAFDVGVIP
jgi:hypothetical protein